MADPDIRVRRAGPDDVSDLVALRGLMFEAMGAGSGGAWRDNAAAWFAERVSDPAYGIVVVTEDGRVVSCATASVRDAAPSPGVPAGGDVLISNVCTYPEDRGRGHGRRAFEAVMEWARGTGVGRAELMATADGRGMYERAGFVENPCPAMRAPLGA